MGRIKARIVNRDLLTEKIIGASYEVMNILGTGFLEKVYENSLAAELRKHDMLVEQQKELSVFYKGIPVGSYFPDLIVENQIIIELKTVKELDPVFSAQVINYLKSTGFKTGLLLNFGKPRIEIKRLYNPE